LDKKINLANEKRQNNISRFSNVKALTGDSLLALDKKTSLPQSNGAPDTARRAKFHEKSLRAKAWDRIVAAKCARCGQDHARKSFPISCSPWEDDFKKGPCWWEPPPSTKQHRSQWDESASACLTVHTPLGIFGVDTQSDISTAIPDVATDIVLTDGIRVNHVAGSTVLDFIGTVTPISPDLAFRSFIVSQDQLPPGLVGIIGMGDIRRLQISLDYVASIPSCSLSAAINPPRLALAPPLPPMIFKPASAPELHRPEPPACSPTAPMLSVPFAFLLLLTSAVQLSSGHRHQNLSGQALLPGTSVGHSLFDQPPRSTSSDIAWVPPFNFVVKDSAIPGGCQPSEPSEPPDTRVCFVQHAPASSFVGGTALRATIDILPEGLQVPLNVSAGIDTQSDVSLATRDLPSDIHAISPDDVHGVGHTVSFIEMGLLDLLSEGKMTRVPALVARADKLPSRCSVILGVPTIVDLGAKLDEQKVTQDTPLVCHLGEKSLRVWWDANKGQSADTKPFDTSAIDINPQMEAKCRDIILAAITKCSTVFEGSSATLPKPFDAPPIELNFKHDATPQSVPEPRWPHAHGKVV
jgi:hypothetical protein